MKRDDIARSVRSARSSRTTGEAPSMGRVSRMPGTGLPKGERRKRRRSEGGRTSRLRQTRRQIIFIWSILLCLGVTAVLAVAGWLWLRPQMQAPTDLARRAPKVSSPALEQLQQRIASPEPIELVAIVRNALAVRDAEEVSEFFRPCETSPADIAKYVAALESVEGDLGRVEWLGSMDANGMAMEGVVVNFRTPRGAPRNRLALLTADHAGVWKIDFDGFARTVSPTWDEFLNGGAPVATVRVYSVGETYYNGPFGDDREWAAYGLASPDTPTLMVGYCKRGSPQAAAMERLTKPSVAGSKSQITRVTLELRRVADSEPRQFEIARVLAEDWAVGPVPFDEQLQ